MVAKNEKRIMTASTATGKRQHEQLSTNSTTRIAKLTWLMILRPKIVMVASSTTFVWQLA
jgi:hypothetical protein